MFQQLKKYYTDRLYRNSLAFILNAAISSFYGLIFWILAARLLPASDIGIATLVISVASMIISLSRLGLDAGLMRFLPSAKDKNVLFNTITIITLALSLLIAVAYLAGLDIFSPAQSFLRGGWLMLIFLGYIAIASINISQNSAITAMRRVDLMVIQNSILGMRIVLLYFIAALGFIGVLLSFNIAYILSLVVGSVILFKNGIRPAPDVRLSAIKGTVKFSFGNYVADNMAALPLTLMPIFIINSLGAEQNAYYFIAVNITSILFTVPSSIAASLFVEGSNDFPMRANTIKALKFSLLILVPMVLVLIVFGNLILSLFGSAYVSHSLDFLKLMAIASVFTIVPAIYVAIKKVHKDVVTQNFVIFAISAMVIVLGYVLLPQFGIIGIGYAWLASSLLVSLLVLGLVLRHDKWELPGYIRRPA
ncbi:MAG TPA: oligosaccharide flippase family protein [Methanocella sp.]|uniref:lipopolysaccharide biosynthesis protein n=1 Tax=Methanocella sp. TaxID=2052833 RepID=UPI002C5D79F6|nr:oligosaccharide flippase family protein [Methanocella sp.]HTY90885.1 oligosaccharide flippase family protein [Methanocella sp.]